METANITHPNRFEDVSSAKKTFVERIVSRGDLPYVSVHEQLKVLEEFSKTSLGRHIILTGGANGLWTDYMISYPWRKGIHAGSMLTMSRLEYYVVFECLSVLAQRELFLRSQQVAQEHVKEGAVLVSLPCGVMRDLLELDFSKVKDINLIGIDIDREAVEAAKKLADQRNVDQVNFLMEDAWELRLSKEADFLSSIGLNVYESNRDRVVALYGRVYEALKPQGVFFTGVLTYPPGFEKQSDWSPSLKKEQIAMDKILIEDVLDLEFQNYRTLEEIKEDFNRAGFKDVMIYPDKNCIFPAVIARKGK